MLRIKTGRYPNNYQHGTLASMIAALLVGDGEAFYTSPTCHPWSKDEATNRYQIGAVNNYWLHKEAEGCFVLSARYPWAKEDAEALARVMHKMWGPLDIEVLDELREG